MNFFSLCSRNGKDSINVYKHYFKVSVERR